MTRLDAVLVVLGLGAVVVGVAQWSGPAAWMVGGAALVSLGVAGRPRAGR